MNADEAVTQGGVLERFISTHAPPGATFHGATVDSSFLSPPQFRDLSVCISLETNYFHVILISGSGFQLHAQRPGPGC